MKIKGFSAAAVQAGIRYSDRLDLGLIFSEVPAVTAGMFTRNTFKAAPVLLDIERLQQGRAQAILVNSGNANACTGAEGMKLAVDTGAMAAQELGIDEKLIQVASTGVIGEPLTSEPFARSMSELVSNLSPDGFAELSEAIMTTDTVAKVATATVIIDGKEVNFLGVAKGSGMIMPDMATMLCFVVTDAQIAFPALKESVQAGVAETFNRITVDGDTSTNDTVLVMANGAAGNKWIDEENPEDQEKFADTLYGVFKDLALKIVADGEGATKVVTLTVTGAREKQEAMDAAKTIANSALVKTAFFGEDANWGRIVAALGRSGCRFQPDRVTISFDDIIMVDKGLGLGADAEQKASLVLKKEEFAVTIDLHDGNESATVFTCDFSYDYVKINADYRS
jgi:glutamate N-acetyltransferase/amino-acid N-acetyltransferase